MTLLSDFSRPQAPAPVAQQPLIVVQQPTSQQATVQPNVVNDSRTGYPAPAVGQFSINDLMGGKKAPDAMSLLSAFVPPRNDAVAQQPANTQPATNGATPQQPPAKPANPLAYLDNNSFNPNEKFIRDTFDAFKEYTLPQFDLGKAFEGLTVDQATMDLFNAVLPKFADHLMRAMLPPMISTSANTSSEAVKHYLSLYDTESRNSQYNTEISKVQAPEHLGIFVNTLAESIRSKNPNISPAELRAAVSTAVQQLGEFISPPQPKQSNQMTDWASFGKTLGM